MEFFMHQMVAYMQSLGNTDKATNQAHQFAPVGAGRSLRSRRCARRYAA